MPKAVSVHLANVPEGDVAALEAKTAVANPHALPGAIKAAAAHCGKSAVLTARHATGEIAGIWPFSIRRVPPGLKVLKAPVMPLYDLSGSPLIAIEDAADTVEAMLMHLKTVESPSRVIVLRNMQAEGPVWDALHLAAKRGMISLNVLERWERSLLIRSAATSAEAYLNDAMSSSSRKRLRSKRKTLEERGKLSLSIHSVSEIIRRPFDRFITLEASGWKGRSGTALKQKPADAAYVFEALQELSQVGRAFIAELIMGERAVASGLFLRCGTDVFFWKTAYDDSLAKQSPGVIFDALLTEWLFEQPWFERLDTGSDHTVDPTTLVWKQRRPMANLVVGLDAGSSAGKAVVAGLQLRAILKRIKDRF